MCHHALCFSLSLSLTVPCATVSEPYTLDTDAAFAYLDPELTEKGRGQAEALQDRAAGLGTELLVVSPLRRATQTGLIAFAKRTGSLPVVATELAHEIGGKHTCDKRGSLASLKVRRRLADVGWHALQDRKTGRGRRVVTPFYGKNRVQEESCVPPARHRTLH